MNRLITALLSYQGRYCGTGINHDNQEFIGEFHLKPAIKGKGVELEFVAKGKDGTIYHEEKTFIAPNELETISLWTLNNNVPYLYEHKISEARTSEGATDTFVFKHNDPNNSNQFRETISIDLWPNGDLSYRYAWGLPGGDFEDRSGLRMQRLDTFGDKSSH